MDYYKLLAVKRNATEAEIRAAYRRLVQNHHPDHSGDEDAVEFRKVQEAYETLSDPIARAAYNRQSSPEISIRVVSRPKSQTVYEVFDRHRRSPSTIREVRRRKRSERTLLDEIERLLDDLFNS